VLRAFRAHRPPAERAARVASPPYDVVTSEEARRLAEGNADSFLRVSRPEIDLAPGTDPHADVVYETGRRNLLELVERGVLAQDEVARLYLYEQRMGAHVQTGVVGCAAVADYVGGRIRRHEATRADKETDRVRHVEALGAHDEPVFLTYRSVRRIDEAVRDAREQRRPAYDFTSDDGVSHRLWVLDVDVGGRLAGLFESDVTAMYVADGHHRSAAAARVHERLSGQGGEHDVFLAVAFPHDQLQVLAYNRVVKDARGRTREELLGELGRRLELEPAPRPAPERPGSFGLYLGGGQWLRALPRERDAGGDDPEASLDVTACERLILEPIFGITDPRRDPQLDFVGGIHGAAALEERVDGGAASLAVYLHPTRVEQVLAVSDAGRLMPPKSTWFEPKLRSGLFVHAF
jgi:uncharacterized protein (DUF1015 family)